MINVEIPILIETTTPIIILDGLGRTAIHNTLDPGQHQITIPIESLPVGIYRVLILAHDNLNLVLTKEFIKE
jgi:hypothetical protein